MNLKNRKTLESVKKISSLKCLSWNFNADFS